MLTVAPTIRWFSLVVVSLALSLGGCATPAWTVEGFKAPDSGGIKRAAYELECPEPQLQLSDLGDSTVGVTGCGKKAIYKWVVGAGWVNNSASDESKTERAKK